MPNIDIFYGITTTTLVVLSSTTLVVFKYFIDSINSAAGACKDSISQLDSKEKTSDQSIIEILGKNSESLKSKHEGVSTVSNWEYQSLFLIIFLSSLSIFLTLLDGVLCDYIRINIKWVLFINLLSIIIYIVAFVSLFFDVRSRRKVLETITTESKMFITSIDDTNALYYAIDKKNKKNKDKNKDEKKV